MTSYLTKVRLVKDDLAMVGDKPSDDELVRIALNGFFKEWSMFVQVISRRDKLPDWDFLWSDFTQELLRLNLVNGTSGSGKALKVEREQENVTLAGKGKVKKGSTKGFNSKGEKKKDLSKVKYYRCHEFGHYVSDCPQRKKKSKKQVAALADADELSSRME